MGIFEKKPDGGKSSSRDQRPENGNGKKKSNRKEPKHRPLLEDRVRGLTPVSHYADLDF
mgnify:CR=1 FL=1